MTVYLDDGIPEMNTTIIDDDYVPEIRLDI